MNPMQAMTRRGFLKLTGAAATALVAARAGLIAYDEPLIATPYKRWIADKGDWYEVFIPEEKSLAGEAFDKPVLLIMGRRSTFARCRVNGFMNCHAPAGGLVTDCLFDASKMVSKLGDRGALNVLNSSGLCVSWNVIRGVS